MADNDTQVAPDANASVAAPETTTAPVEQAAAEPEATPAPVAETPVEPEQSPAHSVLDRIEEKANSLGSYVYSELVHLIAELRAHL